MVGHDKDWVERSDQLLSWSFHEACYDVGWMMADTDLDDHSCWNILPRNREYDCIPIFNWCTIFFTNQLLL